MIEKENARPGVAAPEQASETPARSSTGFPCDFNTGFQRTQGRIEALLHQGQENALRTSFLCAVTGLSQREIVKEVSRERANGALILSTCTGEGGYFLPSPGERGQRETEACLRTMRSRAIQTLQAVHALQKSAQQLTGQLSVADLKGGDE